MEELFEISSAKLKALKHNFRRYLIYDVDWTDRLICIRGPRGVGKTTLMLQYLRQSAYSRNQALYISLDHLYFTNHTLYHLAEEFSKNGGKCLVLDEVHKYPGWSREIKNIYDFFPDLKVVFSGSSALEIFRGEADLSRRAMVYDMRTLSFREFLNLEINEDIGAFSLEDITTRHVEIAGELLTRVKPLQHFPNFLEFGSYPFFLENRRNFLQRLHNTINQVLEVDLPAIHQMDYSSIISLRKLMYVIAISVPFRPNIASLSTRTGSSRKTILHQLDFLEKARLICNLRSPGTGLSVLSKPEKILLDNPNLMHALSEGPVNKGTERETFFANQVGAKYSLHYAEKGDFAVARDYVFEIGGKWKNESQLKGVEKGWVAMDGIEVGFGKKIPLWLFGFLY